MRQKTNWHTFLPPRIVGRLAPNNMNHESRFISSSGIRDSATNMSQHESRTWIPASNSPRSYQKFKVN